LFSRTSLGKVIPPRLPRNDDARQQDDSSFFASLINTLCCKRLLLCLKQKLLDSSAIMPAGIEELALLSLGKGSLMRTFIDHSKPEDSPEHNWVEFTYDGKDDSEFIVVPNHWHREHDEIMEVLEGRMIFYLDGKELVNSAGDPPILIPRGHVHGFTTIKGVAVRATERTVPAGDFKARFFQDMLQSGSMPGFFLAMRVAYDWDMYPSLPGGFKTLDNLFVTVTGLIAKPFVRAKPVALKKLGEAFP